MISITDFFILLLILFIILYVTKVFENFTNESADEKNKACSQKSIDNAFISYIFTSPKFIR